MVKIVKCKRCGHVLHKPESIERGYGKTCYRIIQLHQIKQPEQFDMKEIKEFIASEIERILKEFAFNRPVNNNIEDLGILQNRIPKMPVFNPFEADKRLVIKELKGTLELLVKDGIKNVLQEVGSFDDKIDFLEPIGILA